jgi:hypothetical protein
VLLLGDRGRGRGRRLGCVVLTRVKDAAASPADGDEPPYEQSTSQPQHTSCATLGPAPVVAPSCTSIWGHELLLLEDRERGPMEDLVGRRTAVDLGGRAGLASDANHTAAKLSGGSGSKVGRRWWRRIWAGVQGFGGRETLGFGLESREWYLGLKVLA